MDNGHDNADMTKTDEISSAVNKNDIMLPESFSYLPAPHIKAPVRTQSIMADVMIALLPSFVWGIISFGRNAFAVTAVSVIFCVLFEALTELIMKKKITVGDMSAVVTGMLIGMNLSSEVPLYVPMAAAFFAIVVVKQLFGGLGKNIVNPALAAIVLSELLTSEITSFTDASGAELIYPLASLKLGALPKESVFDLLIGNSGGAIGEVSSLLLIVGGIYLMFRRVITWHIPVSLVASVAIITYAFPSIEGDRLSFMLSEVFSGALILIAFFMATDYVTSPMTDIGKLIYGASIGILTVVIRYFGIYVEGAYFAVLVMNLLVPYIDKYTIPRRPVVRNKS